MAGDHILTCRLTNQVRNIRHDNIVRQVAQLIDDERKVKVVCVQENNMYGSRAKPDLELNIDGERYLLDVSWVCTNSDPDQRYNEKIEKYATDY